MQSSAGSRKAGRHGSQRHYSCSARSHENGGRVIAAKVQHLVKAPQDGKVAKVQVQEGELAPEGKVILTFEQQEEQ